MHENSILAQIHRTRLWLNSCLQETEPLLRPERPVPSIISKVCGSCFVETQDSVNRPAGMVSGASRISLVLNSLSMRFKFDADEIFAYEFNCRSHVEYGVLPNSCRLPDQIK